MLKMNELFKYVIQSIITIIIVLFGLIIIKHNQPPKLVKIDLVAITSHYTQLMTNATMNNSGINGNSEVKHISEMIKTNLVPIINNYSRDNDVVIIQSQALVDGKVPDITNLVINQLDKKLK